MNARRKLLVVSAIVLGVWIVGTLLPNLASLLIRARNRARMSEIIADAKAVMTALQKYAEQHQGQLPRSETSSNQALEPLLADPSPQVAEKHFSAPFSRKFCSTEALLGRSVQDGILVAGENHWAYVSGLINHYPEAEAARIPVLASGFDESAFQYGPTHPFAYEFRRNAIVGYLNGRVEIVPIARDGVTGCFFIPADDNPKLNLFSAENLRKLTGGAEVKVLNPLPIQ